MASSQTVSGGRLIEGNGVCVELVLAHNRPYYIEAYFTFTVMTSPLAYLLLPDAEMKERDGRKG